MRTQQRETARAMADAQREIAKAKPMLDKLKLKDLAGVDVKIDTKQLNSAIAMGMEQQRIAMANLANAEWAGVPVMDKRSETIAVKGKSKVTVDARNCAVTVRGWDRPEVKYVVTRFATGSAGDYGVKSSESGGRIVIKVTDIPETSDNIFAGKKSFDSRVDIYVPAKSDLKIITNKEIRLDGVSGDVDLEGEEGAIDVRDGDGRLTLNSKSNQVRVVGFKGDLVAKTEAGNVFLEGDFASITGESEGANYILSLKDGTDAEIQADTDDINVGGLSNSKKISEHQWRIGNGGSKYRFVTDGSVSIRNSDSILAVR